MRHAAKRDDVEPAIVKVLELAGWTVIRLSDKGAPDLLAIRRGRCVPIECKSPGGKLTPAQVAAFMRWVAAGLPVQVVRTPAEALLAVSQGAEDVLRPVESMRRLHDHVARTAHAAGSLLVHVHPDSIAGKAIRTEVERKGYVDVEEDQIVGHLVTPAFRREQTAAVVPPKKKRKAKRRPCPAGVACTHPWCHTGPQPVDFEEGPDRPNPED